MSKVKKKKMSTTPKNIIKKKKLHDNQDGEKDYLVEKKSKTDKNIVKPSPEKKAKIEKNMVKSSALTSSKNKKKNLPESQEGSSVVTPDLNLLCPSSNNCDSSVLQNPSEVSSSVLSHSASVSCQISKQTSDSKIKIQPQPDTSSNVSPQNKSFPIFRFSNDSLPIFKPLYNSSSINPSARTLFSLETPATDTISNDTVPQQIPNGNMIIMMGGEVNENLKRENADLKSQNSILQKRILQLQKSLEASKREETVLKNRLSVLITSLLPKHAKAHQNKNINVETKDSL